MFPISGVCPWRKHSLLLTFTPFGWLAAAAAAQHNNGATNEVFFNNEKRVPNLDLTSHEAAVSDYIICSKYARDHILKRNCMSK